MSFSPAGSAERNVGYLQDQALFWAFDIGAMLMNAAAKLIHSSRIANLASGQTQMVVVIDDT